MRMRMRMRMPGGSASPILRPRARDGRATVAGERQSEGGWRRARLVGSPGGCGMGRWQRWVRATGIGARGSAPRPRLRLRLRRDTVVAPPEPRRQLLVLQPHAVLHGQPRNFARSVAAVQGAWRTGKALQARTARADLCAPGGGICTPHGTRARGCSLPGARSARRKHAQRSAAVEHAHSRC